VHPDDEPFGTIAHAASRIGSVLYRSDIRWTSITTGREADIPGGVSVRFVTERDLTAEDRRGALLQIEHLAEDEAEIARAFGAKPRSDGGERRRYAGWRERYAQGAPPEPDPSADAAPLHAAPARSSYASSPPPREAPPRQLGEHGTAIMPLVPAEEAVVRPPGLVAPPSDAPPPWRDVGATAPISTSESRGGATNGVGILHAVSSPSETAIEAPEEIDITVDTPPSAAKTWLLLATAVVCVASAIGVILISVRAPAEEQPPAPSAAPSAAPAIPRPAPAVEGTATATPTAQPEPAPKQKETAPPATQQAASGPSQDRPPTRPPKKPPKSGVSAAPPPPKPPKSPTCSNELWAANPCLK
jgi:hypothetical protein